MELPHCRLSSVLPFLPSRLPLALPFFSTHFSHHLHRRGSRNSQGVIPLCYTWRSRKVVSNKQKKKKNQVDFQEGGGIYLLKVHKWFKRQRPQEVNGIQIFKSLMLMKTLHTNSTLGKSAFSSFFFFLQQ